MILREKNSNKDHQENDVGSCEVSKVKYVKRKSTPCLKKTVPVLFFE